MPTFLNMNTWFHPCRVRASYKYRPNVSALALRGQLIYKGRTLRMLKLRIIKKLKVKIKKRNEVGASSFSWKGIIEICDVFMLWLLPALYLQKQLSESLIQHTWAKPLPVEKGPGSFDQKEKENKGSRVYDQGP